MNLKVSAINSIKAAVTHGQMIQIIDAAMDTDQMWDAMIDMIGKCHRDKRAEIIESLKEVA